MKIIISPAKKMNANEDFIPWENLPACLGQAEEIHQYLLGLTFEEQKTLWKCNDEIASLNHQRLKEMSLTKGLVPALLSYEGLQYQYMAPQVFSNQQWEYVNKHLVILSGLYGALRPTDGITPYRLEMQSKFSKPMGSFKDLYKYWGDSIYKELTKDSNVILNLASKEYSKAIEKYLAPSDVMVTCTFGTLVEGKFKVKATEAKMARGEMVRYLATHQVGELDGVKGFDSMNYTYSTALSTEKEFVFLRG
ncbi:MAG: peroxide stress protein YaaA [Turicibacter sp.]|nr:peroxide stress protein YaaA [Turicibacter sp.]